MRSGLLLACAAFASCAVAPERSVLLPEAAPSDPAPRPAAQGAATSPKGLFLVSLAAGKFENESFGAAPNLDDSTDAAMLRLQFEAGRPVGGGASLEFVQTDDDLHDDIGPGGEVEQFDLFGHVSLHTSQSDRFRCPIRIGLFVNNTELIGNSITVFETTSLGARVAAAPEVDVAAGPRHRVSLHATAELGAGVSSIDVDALGEDFDSTCVTVGAELGVRASFPGFTCGLAYVYRLLNVDESDPSGGFFVEEIDYIFHGVQLSAGVRW